MKKIFFSFLAVGALVACTKSEVKFDDASEIAFAPVASTATKAEKGAVQGTSYLANETFYVWAYWKDLKTNSTYDEFDGAVTYIDKKEFKNGGNDLWVANPTYYWPKTGSLIFACLSPAGAPVEDVQHSVLENEFKFAYTNPNETSATVDLMWSECTDSHNEATSAGGVPVTFNHALSWITFKVAGAANDPALNGGYKIESLTINDVYTTGAFASNNREWTGLDVKKDYNVFNSALMGPGHLTAADAVLENGYTDANDSRKGQPFNGTIVIPQKKTTGSYVATLVYTNTLGDSDIEETVYLDLGNGWEIGKHYTYYITFSSSKEIQISPSVELWVPEERTTTVINQY